MLWVSMWPNACRVLFRCAGCLEIKIEAAKAKSELPTASVKGGAFMNHLSHDLVCTTYQLLYVFD